MKEQEFDANLKTKLENLDVPYDPGSWATLLGRLDADGAAPVSDAPGTDAFDARIGQVLERLETPYQPAHWQVMADRLTADRRIRRRIWITKLAEAAIFLLLVAQLEGLICGDGAARRAQPWNREPVAATPEGAGSKQLGSGTSRKAPLTDHQRGRSAAYSMPAANPAIPFAELPYLPTGGGLPGQSLLSLPIDAAYSTPGRNAWAEFAFLPVDASLVEWQRLNDPRYAQQPVIINRVRQNRSFYAGVYASSHRHVIRSQGDERPTSGYGCGFLVGFRPGPWGVEAGLGYSRQRYDPKRQVEIYDGNLFTGYYGSTIVTVDADLLEMPVRATRRLVRTHRTQLHATAGGSVHLALQKDYRYKTAFFPGSAQGPPTAPDMAPQLKRKGNGVLEGGQPSDGNYYVSAQAGLRLEQTLGRQWTAFLQPEYRQAIAGPGIGPVRNRIRGFSVQAGVVATL